VTDRPGASNRTCPHPPKPKPKPRPQPKPKTRTTTTKHKGNTMTKSILLAFAGMTCALAILTTPAFAEQWECNKGTKCRFELKGKKEKQQKFILNGAPFECRSLRKSIGQLTSPSRDLQYKPTFEECIATVAGVKHPVTVEVKECEFRLTIIKPEKKGEHGQQGTVTIKNFPRRKEPKCRITIKIPAVACTLQIGAQGPLTGYRAEQVINSKEEREVQIQAAVTGILTKLAECKVLQIESKTEAKAEYKGRARIEGIKVR